MEAPVLTAQARARIKSALSPRVPCWPNNDQRFRRRLESGLHAVIHMFVIRRSTSGVDNVTGDASRRAVKSPAVR